MTRVSMKIALIVIVGALVLAGCSAKLEGTYADKMGLTSYNFDGDGKVTMSVVGSQMEFDYEQEDDKIRIRMPQGTMILVLLEDGSIDGPGVRLFKSDEKQ